MAIYIHEQVFIDGAGRGKLIELVRQRLAPHLEREHGVRLFGLWATCGSTAYWPEVMIQWEMQDWSQFARAQAGQHPMEERDVYLTQVWNQILECRKHSHATLLHSTAFSPDRDAIQAGGLATEVILHEDVHALPGRLPAYHEALRERYLPLAEKRQMRLLGAYTHALDPNKGINLWALAGWSQWQSLIEAELEDSEMRAWTDGQREWLEDSDAFLILQPPEGVLRT